MLDTLIHSGTINGVRSYEVKKMIEIHKLRKYAFTIVVIFISASFLWAGDNNIENVSCPVPFHVDLQYYVPIDMHLRYDIERYNADFPDFASHNSPEETLLQQYLILSKNGEYEECLRLNRNDEEISQVTKESGTFREKQTLQILGEQLLSEQKAGRNLEKLKIFSRAFYGNESIFTFGCGIRDSDPNFYRTKLTFFKDPNGTVFCNTSKPSPFSSLFMVLTNQKRLRPDSYMSNKYKEFEYEIPLTDSNSSNHPVFLRFNGVRYDYGITSSEQSEGEYGDAIELIRDEHSYYQDNEIGKIADSYTLKSKEKFLDFIQNSDPNYIEWYLNDKKNNAATIKFILDAKPLYIVYYQKDGSKNLSYRYIIRDPFDDDKLKFTNFSCSGFIDDILQDKKYMTGFKKILKNAN